MIDKEEVTKKLQEAFKIEGKERLTAMSSCLLELEKKPSEEKKKEIIERIFREAHSLKGAARAVNSPDIELICQHLESAFSMLKRNNLIPLSEDFDILYYVIDSIEGIMTSSKAIETREIIKKLENLRTGESLPLQEYNFDFLNKLSSNHARGECSSFPLNEIKKTHTPGNEIFPHLLPGESFLKEKDITGKEKLITQEPLPHKVSKKSGYIPGETGSLDTVRISVDKLDSLLLQSEELLSVKLASKQMVIDIQNIMSLLGSGKKELVKYHSEAKNLRSLLRNKENKGQDSLQIIKLLDFFNWNYTHIKSLERSLKTLRKSALNDLQSFGGMVENLLEEMKKTIMLPFATIVLSFPRMVRDISRNSGKEVELIITGEEIEIDKRILEEIKDPLIHLIRNSIDHGIEMPEKRLQCGKKASGEITLSLTRIDSNKFEITVSDDGSGINIEKVKEVSVKKGMISEKTGGEINKEDILSLIFQDDLSTTPIVTDISGRGIGLAIVKKSAEKLGGTVSVETVYQKGTTFRIQLPFTKSTFRGTLFSLCSQEFIIPTLNIERVLRIKKEHIKTIEQKDTITVNSKIIPLVSLAQILELPGKRESSKNEFMTAIIIKVSEKSIAFIIDEILTEQEVMVKNLGKQLLHVRNVFGATILGSGQVVPVLNPSDLIKSAMKVSIKTAVSSSADEEEKRKSILIAEDSITSRILLKNILEGAGYYTKTAVNGAEAFTMLKEEVFDLLMSDVEMPEMNGFQLTEKIRSDEELSELPVILLTALASQSDRERGIDAGANAYIVKSNFEQSNILDIIQKLI